MIAAINRHFDNFVKMIIKDERDKPFVYQVLLSTIILLPLSVLIYFNAEVVSWWVIIYFGIFTYFLGPHLLMLHNICHRSPWRKEVKDFLNIYVSILGLFFGLPPRIYYFHHIKMHHIEGNGENDLSSTMKYNRSSFFHWLIYFIRFSFLGFIELPLYFLGRGKINYAFDSLGGYIFFFVLLFISYIYNPVGTIYIFFIPTAITWFGLMSGNWAQHAFVDQEDPLCPYKNSITVIDSIYNQRCFNDGYHIGHHWFPGMHWTEMPHNFERSKERYYKNNALVFRALDYQIIWFLLMSKRYKLLAKFYVPYENESDNLDRIASLIKSRLLPVRI